MRPVIALAFSNDKDKYLELINRERRNIFNALQDFDDQDYIKVRKVEDTSVEDIFKLFNRYKDRIAIFHYGGHADGTHLLLENKMINGLGLAQLMGKQKQLQLVFLNGCATLKQVDLLVREGVRAVIATSVSIDDEMAVEFAEQFYNALAKEATIQEAFDIASAFITSKRGPSREIKIYRDLGWKKEVNDSDKDVPWGLYIKESSPDVLGWKLIPEWEPPGKTLEDVLQEKIKLPIEDSVDMGISISESLGKMHLDETFNKNITPKNVILDEDNKFKTLRFSAEELKGTYFYISPEQAQGAELDIRDNIWSLGAILYRMVTGQRPFRGKDKQAVIGSIINKLPLLPRDIQPYMSKELQDKILKCLNKRRENRYQTFQELYSKLESIKETDDDKSDSQDKINIELRTVTVMCGEISGYNEMQEKLGKEETAEIMKTCSRMFGEEIETFGGSEIDKKIIDNNFIAFFGLPPATENAPKKAVSAALEIRSQLYLFKQEKGLPVPLDIRIGIDTGEVSVEFNRDEKKSITKITGDPVTLAGQLKVQAANGEIFVGKSTHDLTSDEFRYKQLEFLMLEGRKEPVPVFKFLSLIIVNGSPHDSDMIGRDKELDQLKLQVLKVINGEGSIVNVIGEAGIGKSRLIDELIKIDDFKKVLLLEGRASSISENFSYFPIIDILKNWAKIKEEDSDTDALSKLEHAIANIYPGGAAEVLPFVATLMGLKLTGKHAARVKIIADDAMERLILKNMRQLMIKIADHSPVVCIIHDIHWADLSSIELLESLFRLAEKHRILFINEFRPNYKDTGEPILKTIRERYGRFYLEIKLEPLGEEESEVILQNLAKGIPIVIVTAITRRAEGNPFFIEELLRYFLDEVIMIKNGKLIVTKSIDEVKVPETIKEVLISRIDRLDEASGILLKEASVIGRYFFHKILTKVTKNGEDINDSLENLKETRFILERERLGETEYLFKHTLAREVTYESISMQERKELHLKVAKAIESVFSEKSHEFYGMLALHYNKGEKPDKAEEYLIKAGEEALKAAASREALNYFQEALKLYLNKPGDSPEPGKKAMLEKKIGLAFFNKGYMVEAVEYFDKVFEYWGEKPPRNKYKILLNLVFNLLIGIKILFFPSKKVKNIPGKEDYEILDLCEKRITALSLIDTDRTFIDAITSVKWLKKFDITKTGKITIVYSGISIIFSLTGILFKISGKVLEYAKNSLNYTKNDIKSLLIYNISKLLHNVYAGNWNIELEYDENLINENLNIGEVHYASFVLLFNGLLKAAQGNFHHANLLVKRLYEIGEAYDNDYIRIAKCVLNAYLLLQCRKLNDARDELDAGLSLANKTKFNMMNVFISGMKAYIQILLKDIEGAKDFLSEVRKIVSSEKRIMPIYISSLVLSQFLFDLYMLEESIHSQNQSEEVQSRKQAYNNRKVALKNSKKSPGIKTDVFRLMGVYYWLKEKQKKALTWWSKSIRIGKQLGVRPELARTYMEVGKRLLDKKSKFKQLDGIRAEEYLAKAHTLFKEMKLQKDLDELDKIKSQLGERK